MYGSSYGDYDGGQNYGGARNQGSYGDNRNFGGAGNQQGSYEGAGAGLRPVDWKRANLKPLKKDIYSESPTVAGRSQYEIDAWLSQNNVTLEGKNIPRAVAEFDEVGYPKQITSRLNKNYDRPTSIQSVSWPVALSGRDIISIAKTGSGKTLGFLLPAIMHTLSQPRRQFGEGPSVLVMLPTRELAQQVQEVAQEYCTAMGLEFTCLFGGAPKYNQKSDLRRGIDICIATPGRLLDFLEAGAVTMSRCSFLVLDEADRMLDMGFEPQIRKIVSQIRPDRQTLMFSATWPKKVRTLAMDFQTDPVFLNVGSMELAANHNIEQIVEVIDETQKQPRLIQILEKLLNEKDAKVIIFVDTKRKADDLTRGMRRDGWPALCIHGDKEQRERNFVLNEFKTGKVPILLATDVAARGLDVDGIKVVINYDYSNNSEDYVHRIGRTGRRDNKGTAYTFFTSKDAPKARDLIKILEEARQNIPHELHAMVRPTGGGRGRGRGRGGNFGGQRNSGGGFGAKRRGGDYMGGPVNKITRW